MAKKKIELKVNFEAIIVNNVTDGDYIPSDEVFAEESITLTMPVLDTKYVVLPKVLEGVTDRVIAELNGKYSEFLQKKAAEEKRRREEAVQPSFWRNGERVDSAEA